MWDEGMMNIQLAKGNQYRDAKDLVMLFDEGNERIRLYVEL
jgi:hypothetical protein